MNTTRARAQCAGIRLLRGRNPGRDRRLTDSARSQERASSDNERHPVAESCGDRKRRSGHTSDFCSSRSHQLPQERGPQQVSEFQPFFPKSFAYSTRLIQENQRLSRCKRQPFSQVLQNSESARTHIPKFLGWTPSPPDPGMNQRSISAFLDEQEEAEGTDPRHSVRNRP